MISSLLRTAIRRTSTASSPSTTTLASFQHKSAMSAIHLREKISLIDACLKTGQLSRAKVLYKTIEDVGSAKHVDIHIHNSFLDSFVHSFNPTAVNSISQFHELLSWFHTIKKSGITPNITSYAILLKGALKSNLSADFFRLVLKDMHRTLKDYPIHQDLIFESHVFEPEHVVKLKNIFSKLPDELSARAEAIRKEIPTIQNTTVANVNMPEVVSTKTSNLAYVKKPLNVVNSASFESAVDHQIEIEQESFRVNLEYLLDVSDKRQKATGIGILPGKIKHMATLWHKYYVEILQRQIEKSKVSTPKSLDADSLNDKLDISPFLALFQKQPEKISVVVVSAFLKAFSEGKSSVRALHLVSSIGEGVEQEYRMMMVNKSRVRETLNRDYIRQQQLVQSRKYLDKKFRKLQIMDAENGLSGAGTLMLNSWEKSLKVRIGSVLASWFIETAKVYSEVNSLVGQTGKSTLENAFKHDYTRENSRVIGVFKANDIVLEALETAVSESKGVIAKGILLPKLLPMLVPPKPWITNENGGYITIKTEFMRTRDAHGIAAIKENIEEGRLEKLLAGIDALGRTEWRVNEPLLRHIIHAWNTGKPIAGLPEEIDEKPPEPLPKPENIEQNPEEFSKWIRENKRRTQEYYDKKSLRSTENYKLEIARSFVGKTLYFPHNIDFRGRAYPIPQLFSHMGNDLARSLLVFDKPKKLGERGLKWLKIHFANVYGYDKCSFRERENFVDSNLSKIIKSAQDPFNDSDPDCRFWEHGEKPWLSLGVAMELAEAVKSGNPTEFLSHLPIHQDGSCNGLQHYAALGGDIEGARQVNLASGSKGPQDVYSAVAAKVREMIENDMNQNVANVDPIDKESLQLIDKVFSDSPEGKKYFAKLLTPDRVVRKVVKQPVMTTVYGVTLIGARDQVKARLKEFYGDIYSDRELYALSRYVTGKVFESLNDMFKGAREIMNWFSSAAKEISRSVPNAELRAYQEAARRERELRFKVNVMNGKRKDSASENSVLETVALNASSTVTWTTPLGLTVVQPYRFTRAAEVKTAMQTFRIMTSEKTTPVDVRKQASAFPPNFIHSLDATHMVMTALECQKQDLTFAAVHDSYWTHAADVDELRECLRDQFVELHSQPLLQSLKEEFEERYRNRKVLNVYSREQILEKLTALNNDGSNVRYKLDADKNAIIVDGIDIQDADGVEEEFIEDGRESDDVVSEPTDATLEEEGEVQSDEDRAFEAARKSGILPSRKNRRYFKLWEDMEIPELPKRGSFDIKDVKKSEYFFN